MGTQIEAIRTGITAATRTACRVGFPAAIVLAAVAALSFFLGITTPVRSGPYCTGICMAYPYAEAGAFFPRDYLWMPAAMLIAPLFTVVVACLHFCVPVRGKPFSLLAVSFAVISTGVLVADYLVQLLVVQASLLHGEAAGIGLLTQYNAHGVFIALEDTGYLLMALAFLPAAAAVPVSIRPGAWVRWTFGTAFALAMLAFAGLGLRFGPEMGLPFELAIILIVWIAVVVVAIELTVFFRRAGKAETMS